MSAGAGTGNHRLHGLRELRAAWRICDGLACGKPNDAAACKAGNYKKT